MCEENLNKVKWFIERKDYNGLRLYRGEKREKHRKHIANNLNYAEEEYMDSLVNNLK